MYDAYLTEIGNERRIEKLLDFGNGLGNRQSDHVALARKFRFFRKMLENRYLLLLRFSASGNVQITESGFYAKRADLHFGLLFPRAERYDDALRAHTADEYAVALF